MISSPKHMNSVFITIIGTTQNSFSSRHITFYCTTFFSASQITRFKMANKMTYFLGYIAIQSILFARLTFCDQTPDPAPSCLIVISDASPCVPFITSTSPSPSEDCCSGVRNIAGMAKTNEDKVDICYCLKTILASLKYDPALVAQLPKKCSVNITLPPISNSTDCSK